MKIKALAGILLMALAAAGTVSRAGAAASHDESLGDKIKKIFATPTPTPHKKSASKKKSLTPSPTVSSKASPKSSPKPSPAETPEKKTAAKAKETPEPEETPTPRSSSSRKKKASESAEHSPSASPHHKKQAETEEAEESPTPKRKGAAKKKSSSETAEEDETPTPKKKGGAKKKSSPTPETEEAEVTASPSPGESPTPHGNGAVATISTSEIVGFDDYPPNIKKMIEFAVGLTKQNLGYQYGSADPANGGMDCSGFIYYVLMQQGMKDVARDSREQYIWARKAGTFQAVIGKTDDTFELNALKPGDLLFWTGTYQIVRDPNITHTMIYLGRERGSNQRIMVGSSDGRTYKGQSRYGVSIFDFHVARQSRKAPDENGNGPAFVGYARIPGLVEGNTR